MLLVIFSKKIGLIFSIIFKNSKNYSLAPIFWYVYSKKKSENLVDNDDSDGDGDGDSDGDCDGKTSIENIFRIALSG